MISPFLRKAETNLRVRPDLAGSETAGLAYSSHQCGRLRSQIPRQLPLRWFCPYSCTASPEAARRRIR
jgi:hypothetical protein